MLPFGLIIVSVKLPLYKEAKMSNFLDWPVNIKTIDTHYIKEKMVASHLMVENNEALFIDVGTAPACPLLLKGLQNCGLRPEDVRYIILTHIHLDHAGGASTLMRHCPKARLLVHPRGARHMIDPERLIKASLEVYGKELFTRLYGDIVPIPEKRIESVGEGFVLDFHGRSLHFFDTPGHARHHLSIWDPTSSGIFTGDTIGMAYPEVQIDAKKPLLIPATAPAAFEPDELINSINRLMKLRPSTFYLPHFGPVKANQDSVASLIHLIEQHGRLAELGGEVDLDYYTTKILDMLYRAYSDLGGKKSKDAFNTFLAGDITLNAQGIAARSIRLRKQLQA